MTVKELEEQSLKLKSIEKIHLVEALLASLDKPDMEIEAAWVKESEKRFAAYERGELETLSVREVMKDLEDR